MTRKERLRKWLILAFWTGLLFTLWFSYDYARAMIPDKLSIVVDEKETFRFPFPVQATILDDSQEVVLNNESNIPAGQLHLQRDETFSLYSENQGTYHLGLKLFGLIDFKDIEIEVVDTQYAIPCGTPVGIYLKSDGVMVIGTGEVTGKDGSVSEPADGLLKSGDYIEAINGQPLCDKDDMIQAVNASGESTLVLDVRRGGDELKIEMNPVATAEGDYKLGLWIRDDTQGIGTMTYVDMNGNFGALGHGISDSDTGMLVDITEGELYETDIMGIEKGSLGSPGVMSGVIYYGDNSSLGHISANTDQGIFGTVNDRYQKKITSEPLPIAYRQDIQKGQAYIRSSISGEVRDYEIEIQKIDYSTAHKNKGMVIKVVDEELLALTGGIVQGMSGSPIIQNGKLIGAVTHVFVQDSTKGYGIFIENMLSH